MCVTTTVYVCDCVEIVRTSSCESSEKPGCRRVPCREHAAAGTFGTQPHRRRRVVCSERRVRVLCYCEHYCAVVRVWMLFNYSAPPRRHAIVCPVCVGNFNDMPFSAQIAPDHVGTFPAT